MSVVPLTESQSPAVLSLKSYHVPSENPPLLSAAVPDSSLGLAPSELQVLRQHQSLALDRRHNRDNSRESSISEMVTDVQEYDDGGRLRKRTVTRRSSGSSIGSLSHSIKSSIATSANPKWTIRLPAIPAMTQSLALDSPFDTGFQPSTGAGRYLKPLLPDRLKELSEGIPCPRSNLKFKEKKAVLRQLFTRLCECAYEFVAGNQLPLQTGVEEIDSMEVNGRPIFFSAGEWNVWTFVLQTLSRQGMISRRVIHQGCIEEL